MKLTTIAIIALLGVLLASTVACGSSSTSKPTVGYVPVGWSLHLDKPYGEYVATDGTKSGSLLYESDINSQMVAIFYGDIPVSLIGHENDQAYLIDRASEETKDEPQETGIMSVYGQTAGYKKTYYPDDNLYSMTITFIYKNTCIDIITGYNANSKDEAQVMALINSINFK